MTTSTLGLAALLVLGATVAAPALDGRGMRLEAPSPGLERGPAPTGADIRGLAGPRGDRSPGAAATDDPSGFERRAEGPNPDARKGAPEGEPSGAERIDRPGDAGTSPAVGEGRGSAPDGAAAAGAGHDGEGPGDRCSRTLTLSDGERDDILRSLQAADEAAVSDITVGWSVPGEIELKPFPEPVVTRAGKLAACRYFVAEGRVAIVDPVAKTVVLLIDRK